MSEHVDELSIQYEEDGEVLVRELDKVILSKGAWATILFRISESQSPYWRVWPG